MVDGELKSYRLTNCPTKRAVSWGLRGAGYAPYVGNMAKLLSEEHVQNLVENILSG